MIRDNWESLENWLIEDEEGELCNLCGGEGAVDESEFDDWGKEDDWVYCPLCGGTGYLSLSTPD